MNEEVFVPLATYESPLWPSTNRGAKATRLAGGIAAVLISNQMTRSILVQAPNAAYAKTFLDNLDKQKDILQTLVSSTSRFAKLINWHSQVLGNLIYLRFALETGDASGHNMVTKASDVLLQWILEHHTKLKHLSVSGNFCVDKKVSAVNGILGRGKNVVTEVTLSREICQSVLKTTPEKIHELNIKKNWMGSQLAGGVRTANAHFANMLLAFYLATGQDAANIVEGSQGFVVTEITPAGLYISATCPNLIVGTVGNGKHFPFVQENLKKLGCLEPREPGENAVRLALIMAGTILCGELSLLAAQTNPGELMRSHFSMERQEHAQST